MYTIRRYQLITARTDHDFLITTTMGAKIPGKKLSHILAALNEFKHYECSEAQLNHLAEQHEVELLALKTALIEKLQVLKPLNQPKIPKIYIDSDDEFVATILQDTLSAYFPTEKLNNFTFNPKSMVLCYRHNYSNPEFEALYQHLAPDVYVITAGVLHQTLLIDNLYFKQSGLPTHFSNLQHLLAYLKGHLPSTKNNWLLFYRELLKEDGECFPDALLNCSQRGYIAYCLYRFVSQYLDFWQKPTFIDQVNCFWQADLNDFTIHKEAAVHSPFSEFDLKLETHTSSRVEVV